MSTWLRDNPAMLLQEAAQIAFNFLARSGEIEDPVEAAGFLADNIHSMIRKGQRNRLALANRAITAFQRDQESGRRAHSRGPTRDERRIY